MSKFPKANTSIEKRAKSVEEAVSEALSELGINETEAVIEVIKEPSKGFLGLGAKEAVVKVSVKSEETDETEINIAAQPDKDADTDNYVNLVYHSESPAENAKNFISDILSAMGVEATVTAELKDDIININIEGENMGIVIGKRGDTLDSLQYLTSLVVNRQSEDYIKISIDTEDYRRKRSEALVALSNRLAVKVAKTGKKFALEPMNPYERRIIHSNLQDSEEVTTFSVGQEPYRKVIIAPKNQRPYNRRGGGRPHSIKRTEIKRDGYTSKAETTNGSELSVTYKADFKPQQHKAEYKNFEEYLAAHSKD